MNERKKALLMQLPIQIADLLSLLSFDGLEEIRFRSLRPVMLHLSEGQFFLSKKGGKTKEEKDAMVTDRKTLSLLTETLCNSSVYALLQDLKDGFITLKGGHRVGLAGKCVLKDGQVYNITNISGINIRVAHEYLGCAKALMPYLKKGDKLSNALIIGPPSCGKTTLLRDLARLISESHKVTIVDERSEIAATFDGVAQFDIGLSTDVLDRFPKSTGMLTAIRALSPQVLITDEIGTENDIHAIFRVLDAGCKLIASIHGYDITSIQKSNPRLLACFDTAIILGRINNRPSILEIKELG